MLKPETLKECLTKPDFPISFYGKIGPGTQTVRKRSKWLEKCKLPHFKNLIEKYAVEVTSEFPKTKGGGMITLIISPPL